MTGPKRPGLRAAHLLLTLLALVLPVLCGLPIGPKLPHCSPIDPSFFQRGVRQSNFNVVSHRAYYKQPPRFVVSRLCFLHSTSISVESRRRFFVITCECGQAPTKCTRLECSKAMSTNGNAFKAQMTSGGVHSFCALWTQLLFSHFCFPVLVEQFNANYENSHQLSTCN